MHCGPKILLPMSLHCAKSICKNGTWHMPPHSQLNNLAFEAMLLVQTGKDNWHSCTNHTAELKASPGPEGNSPVQNTCNSPPPFNWHLEVKQTSIPLYSVSSIRVSLCVRVWGCECSSLPTVVHWNQRAEQTDRLTLCVCSDYLSAHESVLQVTEGECVYKVCLCIYKRLAFACVSITGGCVGMISHWVLI